MALRFDCPICKHVLTAKNEAAGKKARCPECSYVMIVPKASTIDAPPVDATDLLAMLGDRVIEAPPKPDEAQAHQSKPPHARTAKTDEAKDESLYDPQNVGREKAKQREQNRGVWNVFVADCFRCADAAMGFSSVLFMVGLLVVLAGAAFAGEIFLFRSTNGKAAQGMLDFIATGPGRGVCALAGVLLGLYLAGYFMTYFIDSANYKLRALSLAPCFPGLAVGKLMLGGLKALGVLLVYIAPVVTIPLLPLGLMGLAQTDDWRAFDVIWAAKAAVRRIKELVIAWAVIMLFFGVGFAILASVWPFLGSFLTVDSLGTIQGPMLTLTLLAVGVALTLVVVTIIGSMITSVAGVLGWHFPDMVAALPPRNKWVGSIASGGIVAAVGVIVVAGSFLCRPFLFTQNIREVTTLAWFFADAVTPTAPAGHVSPEPEQWEVAWNDFFPIKAPPLPSRPIVQAAPPAAVQPVTAQPNKPAGENDTARESELVQPTPAPAARPVSPVASTKPSEPARTVSGDTLASASPLPSAGAAASHSVSPASAPAGAETARLRERMKAAEAVPPPSADEGAKDVAVEWDTPDLIAVDAVNHDFFKTKICQSTKEFKDPRGFVCFAGVVFGPEAASRDDEAYKDFARLMSRKFDALIYTVNGVHDRKELPPQTFNKVQYDRVNAFEASGKYITIFRAVDDGRCVCYWYNGTSDGLARFIATALGRAKAKK